MQINILIKNLGNGEMVKKSLGKLDRIPQRGELLAVDFGSGELPYQIHQIVTYIEPKEFNKDEYQLMFMVKDMLDKR